MEGRTLPQLSPIGTVNTFQRNKEASPQKKRREASNAIARPQEPWAQEGGRYYTNLTYSIQEVNPEESDGSRLRRTSPAKGEKPSGSRREGFVSGLSP